MKLCLAGTERGKEKDLHPTYMGQKSLNFCDTTQIDVIKRPLAYAHHHTRPDG